MISMSHLFNAAAASKEYAIHFSYCLLTFANIITAYIITHQGVSGNPHRHAEYMEMLHVYSPVKYNNLTESGNKVVHILNTFLLHKLHYAKLSTVWSCGSG